MGTNLLTYTRELLDRLHIGLVYGKREFVIPRFLILLFFFRLSTISSPLKISRAFIEYSYSNACKWGIMLRNLHPSNNVREIWRISSGMFGTRPLCTRSTHWKHNFIAFFRVRTCATYDRKYTLHATKHFALRLVDGTTIWTVHLVDCWIDVTSPKPVTKI